MFKKIFSKWLNVESFSSNKKISRFFVHLSKDKWNSKNLFLSILALKVNNNFNYEYSGKLEQDERSQLLRLISKLKGEEPVTKKDYPNIKDKRAVMNLGHFISILTRTDLGMAPRTASQLVPCSVYTLDADLTKVIDVFNLMSYDNGKDYLSNLRKLQNEYKLKYWREFIPHMLGPFFVIKYGPLLYEDAYLIATTGSSFIYDNTLGMVNFESESIAMIRKSALVEIASYVEISNGLNLSGLERILTGDGWTVTTR